MTENLHQLIKFDRNHRNPYEGRTGMPSYFGTFSQVWNILIEIILENAVPEHRAPHRKARRTKAAGRKNMGSRLIWEDNYNVGVDIIDKEHKKLFSILNKLFDFGNTEEKSHFACQEAIKYFKDHAIQHFADEEAYMASIDYPGLTAHRRIHQDFRERTLPALENELELTHFSGTSIHHFLDVCAGWLIGHTLIEDHMIVSGEPIWHWEQLLPEEEQAVMGQTIAGLLRGMFRLDSRLISNCYAGEKIGDGICCRLSYSGEDNRKWEYFMLFEKQLIGSTIGNVIAANTDAADRILSNVAKYAARQLAERIKQHFISLEQLELTGEQLLTYEQFYKMYEKISPQFSFLFDTGKGYFACCMAASEISLRRNGLSAITDNAMADLESRLFTASPPAPPKGRPLPGNLRNEDLDPHGSANPRNEDPRPHGSANPRNEDPRPHGAANPRNEDLDPHGSANPRNEDPRPHGSANPRESPWDRRKKKILVVDDSYFVRTTMLHLLSDDYQVLTADSCVSAIRSITLARPDLVLLDYEMPVCNGGQILEMIRSEKDFSDLPVIFLTCRVDRDSVRRAISLKPEGYLSKFLPAESVKKEIDRFFENDSP